MTPVAVLARVPVRPSFRDGAIGLARAASLALLMILALVGGVLAEAALPPLTGRVVDDASLLSPTSRAALDDKLKALEAKSSIQLVVATVKSLGGEEIEPFANRLFRAWKLGEKQKNNGALMLIAPAEHKARIEVGYGLEGTLTDALSKIIITNALVPRFKANDFQGGIEKGVDDVIAVLSTDQTEWRKRPDLQKPSEAPKPKQDQDSGFYTLLPFLIVGAVILFFVLRRRSGGGGSGSGGLLAPTAGGFIAGSSGSSGGSGGDSSGDSGFSGGGGSSGGGGASGDW
jgi:uncharacterized protein